jgi:hypothetical protein
MEAITAAQKQLGGRGGGSKERYLVWNTSLKTALSTPGETAHGIRRHKLALTGSKGIVAVAAGAGLTASPGAPRAPAYSSCYPRRA